MAPEAEFSTDWGLRFLWFGAFVVFAGFLGGGGIYVANSRVVDPDPVVATVAPAAVTMVAGRLDFAEPSSRTVDPYIGYGTWVDVFDYDAAYRTPTVGAEDFAEMAELGVTTVYLQAARLDDRTPDGLVDP